MVTYTVKEAAEKSKMSVAWWRKMIFEKKLRHLRIGNRVFIPETTIEELFKNGVVEPVDQRQA